MLSLLGLSLPSAHRCCLLSGRFADIQVGTSTLLLFRLSSLSRPTRRLALLASSAAVLLLPGLRGLASARLLWHFLARHVFVDALCRRDRGNASVL